MKEAAADLEFETAARLRDEVKRLRETELAVADDPLARQGDVEERAGAYQGARKYGPSANVPPTPGSRRAEAVSPGATRARKPTLDEMGPGTDLPVPARSPQVDPRAKAGAFGEHVRGPHKPTLDEMGPHAERGLPVAGKAAPVKPVTRTIEVLDDKEKRGRRGRARKTGRPGA